jgi:hypothetical protein
MLTTYDTCEKHCSELHNESLDENENTIFIPAKFSVVIKDYIPIEERNLNQLRTDNKDTGIRNYGKAVKEILGIDMRDNYSPQYNKEYYDRIDLIVPGSRVRGKETDGFDKESQ